MLQFSTVIKNNEFEIPNISGVIAHLVSSPLALHALSFSPEKAFFPPFFTPLGPSKHRPLRHRRSKTMSSSRLLAVLALVLAVAGHGWAAAATDEVASPGPTQEPTLGPPVSTITGFYQQDMLLTEEKIFTDLEVLIFEDLHQSYTPFYGPGESLVDPDDPSSLITTKCEMTGDSLLGASSVVADRFEDDRDEDAPPKLSWKLRVIFRITWS